MFTIPIFPSRFRQRPFVDPMHHGRTPAVADRVLAPAGEGMANWGPLGFENFPLENRQLPDRRNYLFPSGIARGFPDLQLRNGVADLSSGYNTRPGYYAARPLQNPTLAQRYGGRAQQAPGALTTQDWHDRLYAGTPATGNGPGSIALATRVRRRLGWSA